MTDWKELYQQKLIPVEDIVKVIPPHSHCSLSDGAADPRAITREIEKRYQEFTDVSFMQGPPGERIEMFDPDMAGHIRRSLAPLGNIKITGKAYMLAFLTTCPPISRVSSV